MTLPVHSYFLREIDLMRAALHERELRRRLAGSGYIALDDGDKRRLEEHLRTYMMAGIEPAEIIQSARDEPYNAEVWGDRSGFLPE